LENEFLSLALEDYARVQEDYLSRLRDKGLVFAPVNSNTLRIRELREKLASRGVEVRNAGASLSWGFLSPACVECTGAAGSETFSTTFKCHRDCYFCFNRNLADYDKYVAQGCPWRDELTSAAQNEPNLACIGLTGGEPLLNIDDTIEFLHEARKQFPNAHLRMYTSGDLLTEETAQQLAEADLQEIRFSVKDDDSAEMRQKVLDAMAIARKHIPTVMVEMPVAPGKQQHMRDLFVEFNKIGIDGINLLEFCFPFSNWEDFKSRGFLLKNPPFDVMYDYSYSGGLAVNGSELEILELMDWALDNDITFGMHYCSLDNKHRSEIRQKNERAKTAHPCLQFDEQDFFLKAAKLFGGDALLARDSLKELGCTDTIIDGEEHSIAFHPKYLEPLKEKAKQLGLQIDPAMCYFVYETQDGQGYFIDVALRVI
jgi:pyruvate formate-lyase activating enzyme-like uncharacterized protein